VTRFFGNCAGFLCILALAACDDSAINGPTADILSSNANDDVDASSLSSTDALSDVPPEKGACQGSFVDPAMAPFDDQCSFLDKCLHAGSCFCGDGCPANKVKCDDAYCPNAHPKCYCGSGCDAKVVQCPEYICQQSAPSTGCEPHDDCIYNPAAPPSWCGCQQMPDHCSCGSDCLPNVQLCDAKVCKNYPAKGCTAQKNSDGTVKTFENCYCQQCGTLAQKPHCYYLLCPGPKP
jgi:hypothetical protein